MSKTKVHVRVLPTERDTQNRWHVDGKEIVSSNNPSDLLANNRSSDIILYGYSGTGKSFTIFGKDAIPGILQRSLDTIKKAIGPDETIS